MQGEKQGIRINKYLSEAGVCSRREADREIEAGHVRIGSRIAVMGDRVMQDAFEIVSSRPCYAA